jgi:ParB family chromosome partitioning protein
MHKSRKNRSESGFFLPFFSQITYLWAFPATNASLPTVFLPTLDTTIRRFSFALRATITPHRHRSDTSRIKERKKIMSEPKIYRRQIPNPPVVDEDSSILFISVDRIRPNRTQPRNRFDTNTMIRLADSVRRYGILQPLTVRQIPQNTAKDMASHCETVYELIAGERRLRAAKLAGLTHVPCVVASADDHLSAELAIIENLLREDLNMFEQARAFGRLILQFSLTQEQVARKMSMSQSAVANKLRLLRLSDPEQRAILEGGLTERHARALLRLPSGEMRGEAICRIVSAHLNVAATEEYVDSCLSALKTGAAAPPAPRKAETVPDDLPKTSTEMGEMAGEQDGSCKKKLVLRDLRLFYNSLERAVGILKQTGLTPEIEQREEGNRLEIRISVDQSI